MTEQPVVIQTAHCVMKWVMMIISESRAASARAPGLLLAGAIISSFVLTPNAALAESGKPQRPAVSADFPYTSKYVDVDGAKMAYIELGDPDGEPILFVHGVPTWSYLWRNVLPYVKVPGRRLIAVDLMGFGRSEKARNGDIGYFDHAGYFAGFIEALGLKNVTLVLHDWGAAIGLNYAYHHSGNVRAIAFMEGVVAPAYPRPSFESFGNPKVVQLFRSFRDPVKGPEVMMTQNMWIERLLPNSIMRELTDKEMAMYRAPWPTKESRRPIWRLVQDNPIEGKPKAVTKMFLKVERWWRKTDIPKLFVYASPGRILRPDPHVNWMVINLKNIKTAFVGYGIHFLQEDEPEAIGRVVNEWLRDLNTK